MKRLDRLILGEIIGPYFGSILLFTGLFMGADTLLKILDYASKGVSPLVLFQFFLTALPPVLALTSPVAMLLAALLGFGRLSGDSELTAISAAGVPLERVMAPLAAFAFFISCVGFYINDTVVPISERSRQAFIDQQKKKAGNSFGGEQFSYRQTDSSGKIALLVHSESPITTTGVGRFQMSNVTIVQYENGKASKVITAPRAEGSEGNKEWTLWGLDSFGRDQDGQTYSGSGAKFSGQQTTIATPEALQTAARPNAELTTRQLQQKVEELQKLGSATEARSVQVEMARRIMVPLSSFIFALVGAPLGITPNRASKGVGFGYSVLITFLYWVTLQFVSVLGQNGTLPPFLAVSIPNIAGIALGIYLIWRIRR